MTRTLTTKRTSFSRPGSVTYTLPIHHLPIITPAHPLQTTIVLPPGSNWSSGLHWHATHNEYLRIVQGAALVTIAGVTRTYTSEDGLIFVPRYVRHEWKRATKEGGDLVVKEWTDANDGLKEVFFRNLSSVIEDEVRATKGNVRGWLLEWRILVICFALDNWPVFVDVERFLPFGLGRVVEEWVSWVVLGVLALAGRWVGIKGTYEEYTPRALRERRGKYEGWVFVE